MAKTGDPIVVSSRDEGTHDQRGCYQGSLEWAILISGILPPILETPLSEIVQSPKWRVFSLDQTLRFKWRLLDRNGLPLQQK